MLSAAHINYLKKLLPIYVVFIGLVAWLLNSSITFAYETQSFTKCLPHTFWAMDSDVVAEDITIGSLVKVSSSHYPDFYQHDVPLLKMVMGVAGDIITITDNQLFINDQYAGYLFHHEKYPAPFTEYIIKDGEVWLSGTSDLSVDSRYLGAVKISHVEAHAYAII